MVDELSGTVRTKSEVSGGAAPEEKMVIRYEMNEIGGARKRTVECEARVEVIGEGEEPKEEEVIRVIEISHREAERRAWEGKALIDLGTDGGAEKRTRKGTRRRMKDRRGAEQHFEVGRQGSEGGVLIG